MERNRKEEPPQTFIKLSRIFIQPEEKQFFQSDIQKFMVKDSSREVVS
jgi:hypothetical protein